MSLSPLALAVFLATVAAVAAAFVASVGWWARPVGESAAAHLLVFRKLWTQRHG